MPSSRSIGRSSWRAVWLLRPVVGHQIVREFVYGLAAVSPFVGKLCSFIPPTLHLLPLPLYSPGLNPVEHRWEYLHENYIGNHVFSSLDAVINQLSAGL